MECFSDFQLIFFGFMAHSFTDLIDFHSSTWFPAAAGNCFQRKSSYKPGIHYKNIYVYE